MAHAHQVVAIPGDGIGPEVMEAVRRVFEAARAPVRFVEHHAGQAALDAGLGSLLPDATLDAIREHGVALEGPCTTPVGTGFRSVNVALRQTLQLFAAVRPVRNLPGIETRFRDVDLVIVRENTEGLYSGIENVVAEDVVVSMKVATRKACRRVASWAFQYATERKRRKVTVLHKANIMKLTDGMFLDSARAVHAEEAPDVSLEEMIIDAATMRLVQVPEQFDILLCENLYGDIVSDLCAGLVGGLGVTPGANFGEEHAVFEAVHGTAPDIAGRDLANPLALVMSGVMLLNHLAETRRDDACRGAAERIKRAYDAVLGGGIRTRDLGGEAGTRAFTDAIVAAVD